MQLEHETIDLRLRQRISPFLLDRILRRQYQERLLQGIRLVADGDLLFLHRFEQGALHFRGGAIDFVSQHEIGEDRALLDRKIPRARIVNLRADDVGGQQIGRELDALEGEVQSLRERADGERFR